MLNNENTIKIHYDTIMINFTHYIGGSYYTILSYDPMIKFDVL